MNCRRPSEKPFQEELAKCLGIYINSPGDWVILSRYIALEVPLLITEDDLSHSPLNVLSKAFL